MAVQPEANGVNVGLAPGATHHDGGPKIVPVLTPGKLKRIAYEITTFEEVGESAPVSRPRRTVMDSVTERLLSQAPDGVRLVPTLEADRVISGDTVAKKLAGLSVPLFHIKDLHPSIDGNKPFEHHVETVFNSSVNGFVRVARILERYLVNNADRMPDAHAHTLQLREIITQLAGVADGTIQTTPPELAHFKMNVEVFDQNVLARQRAGAYVDPIELQMYAAAEKSFSAIRQQEALCAVAKIPGFDGLESEHKDAAWKFSILEGGTTTQAEQYVAEVMRSQNAALPLERVVAGTIVQLWEGFGTTMMALHELPSRGEIPQTVVDLAREGAVSMEQILQNHSGSRPMGEIAERLRERADEIRQRQTQYPSLTPVATEAVAGIETFLGGLQQYQRVEAIISRPNAHLLTEENLLRMLVLEQFAQEHPQELGELRRYAAAIDAGGVFAYMIQPVEGYPTEQAYLLDHIQSKLTLPAALNPKTWEARKIEETPLPLTEEQVRITTLENFIRLHPGDTNIVRMYGYLIGVPDIFNAMGLSASGSKTEMDYILSRIREYSHLHALPARGDPDMEARQISQIPVPVAWETREDGWVLKGMTIGARGAEIVPLEISQQYILDRDRILESRRVPSTDIPTNTNVADQDTPPVNVAPMLTQDPADAAAAFDEASIPAQTSASESEGTPSSSSMQRSRLHPLAAIRAFFSRPAATLPEIIPPTLPPRGERRRERPLDETEQVMNGRVFRGASQPWRWQSSATPGQVASDENSMSAVTDPFSDLRPSASDLPYNGRASARQARYWDRLEGNGVWRIAKGARDVYFAVDDFLVTGEERLRDFFRRFTQDVGIF